MPNALDRLLIKIDADAANLVKGLQQTGEAADTAAVKEARLQVETAKTNALNAAAAKDSQAATTEQLRQAGATDELAAAEARLTEVTKASKQATLDFRASRSNLAVVENDSKNAEKALAEGAAAGATEVEGLSGAMSSAGSVLSGGLGIAVAAGAALQFKTLESGIKNFVNFGQQVYVVQGLLGDSAKEASLLTGQFQQLGIAPDLTARAMNRFGSAIGDGTSKLGQFGIQVVLNKNGTTDLGATLENLRKAYQDSSDAATRDAIAKQLQLRGATALLPWLKLTTDQQKALNDVTKQAGLVFDQQQVDNAHALSIQSNQVKTEWQGVLVAIGEGVAPLLSDVLTILKAILPIAVEVEHTMNKWVVGPLLAPLTQLAKLIDGSSASSKNLSSALNASTDAMNGDTSATQANIDAQNQDIAVRDHLISALQGEENAEKGVRDSVYAVADAKLKLSDDTAKLSELLATNGIDAAKVSAAMTTMVNAEDSATSAAQRETDAQNKLNLARQAATALDLAEAESKVALAGDKITAAQAAVQQAREKLDALIGTGAASAGEIAAAQAELKTKQDDVTQSTLDQQQATVDLNKEKQKGTELDPAVQSAERELANAHRDSERAVSAEVDAYGKLLSAQKPAADFDRKVADLQETVAKDRNAVTDALDEQTNKALALTSATDKLNSSLQTDGSNLEQIWIQLLNIKAAGGDVSGIAALLLPPPGVAATAGPPVPPAPPPVKQKPPGPGSAVPTPATTTTGTTIPGRAAGGPTMAGETYLVGERGPEILRMGSQSGYIAPNAQGGPTFKMDVIQQFHGYDSEVIAEQAAREANWQVRTTVLPRLAGRT